MILEGVDGIVCDLDGVVYRGEQPVPGAVEAVERLRAAGIRLLFCTNNSRSSVEQYRRKLERLGVAARPDEILTSAVVTAEVLAAHGFTGKRAIVVGGEGIRGCLAGIGVDVDDDPQAVSSDLVVVGWDPSFDFGAMRRAALAVRRGATFVATNDDASFPAAGELWPGAGAILASIEVASGRKAEVMGKPHSPMMEAAARRLEGAARLAIVGDRPDTDLSGGWARGWTTVLVLSGVTAPEDVPALRLQPDVVVDSLADLFPGATCRRSRSP